ncbi:hypothetical protein [Chondromyces crocatus]|nr:hypothetical protein [Chondromyces crocatus]
MVGATGGLLGLGGLIGAGACAAPTAITVDIYTEVACEVEAEVSLTVSPELATLAEQAPSATSRGCLSAGRVGDVVIAPVDQNDKQLAYAVATRREAAPVEGCLETPIPADCILARRKLRFSPGEALRMRVDLRDACLGVDCPAEQTCVKGYCVSAEVSPEQCATTCDEGVLVGGEPPVRLTSDVLSTPQVVAHGERFVVAWAARGENGEAIVLRGLDPQFGLRGPEETLAAEGGALKAHRLGSTGERLGLFVMTEELRYMTLAGEGPPFAWSAQEVEGMRVLVGRGMPWSGRVYGTLLQAEPGVPAPQVVEKDWDAVEGVAPESRQFCQDDCNFMSVAWSGQAFGAAFSVEFNTPSCWWVLLPGDGEVRVDVRSPVSGVPGCVRGHLASLRSEGRWSYAYEASGARIFHARYDVYGNAIGEPTQVSRDDGLRSGHARTITTAEGAPLVFFTSGSSEVNPLFMARLDGESGAVVAPAMPVDGVFVEEDRYEVDLIGDRVAVVWLGRTEAPAVDAPADGAYVRVVAVPGGP